MFDKKKFTLGYIPGMGTGQVAPFDAVFENSIPISWQQGKVNTEVINRKNMDAVVIWGGEDIYTGLYNEKPSRYTGADHLGFRDKIEGEVVAKAIQEGVPIIGICRGAQLVCAMAGGKLVQHVENHGRTHKITTNDGRSIKTSSVHHQMMWPWETKHTLLAWASDKLSKIYVFNDKDIKHEIEEVEPEVVFFEDIKALAIQGHPEFMNPNEEFVHYCNELVSTYLLDHK